MINVEGPSNISWKPPSECSEIEHLDAFMKSFDQMKINTKTEHPKIGSKHSSPIPRCCYVVNHNTLEVISFEIPLKPHPEPSFDF